MSQRERAEYRRVEMVAAAHRRADRWRSWFWTLALVTATFGYAALQERPLTCSSQPARDWPARH